MKTANRNPSTLVNQHTETDENRIQTASFATKPGKLTIASDGGAKYFIFRRVMRLEKRGINGPLSRTTRVSRYQKGKTNLDFTEARDSEWQWHQLGRMQVCTSLQTDNHASTPPLSFYRPDALPAAQPTASKH